MDVRTTVSFARVIWKQIEENMAEDGFNNNVSAYLAHLVRADTGRRVELAALLARGSQSDEVSKAEREIIERAAKRVRRSPNAFGASPLYLPQKPESPAREILGFRQVPDIAAPSGGQSSSNPQR